MNEVQYNALTKRIIGCAIDVHKEPGPGLMESVYEACLKRELVNAGLKVKCRVVLPLYFKGEQLDKHFIIDMIVENEIIPELKSLAEILPIHEAQLVTYLKLANKKIGLIINFNEILLKDGIRRKINSNLTSV